MMQAAWVMCMPCYVASTTLPTLLAFSTTLEVHAMPSYCIRDKQNHRQALNSQPLHAVPCRQRFTAVCRWWLEHASHLVGLEHYMMTAHPPQAQRPPQQAPALPVPEAAPTAEVAAAEPAVEAMAAMAGGQAPAAETAPAADTRADATGAGLIDAAVTSGAAVRQEPGAGRPTLPAGADAGATSAGLGEAAGPSEAALGQEPMVAAEASQGASSVQSTDRKGRGSAAAAAEAAAQEGEVLEPGEAARSAPSDSQLRSDVSADEQPKRHRWVRCT